MFQGRKISLLASKDSWVLTSFHSVHFVIWGSQELRSLGGLTRPSFLHQRAEKHEDFPPSPEELRETYPRWALGLLTFKGQRWPFEVSQETHRQATRRRLPSWTVKRTLRLLSISSPIYFNPKERKPWNGTDGFVSGSTSTQRHWEKVTELTLHSLPCSLHPSFWSHGSGLGWGRHRQDEI